ncbi:MAG: restriction endonuclease [Burkholderiales bacterium PBB3]|nr:MAG: restriction endonuclease [Burkholderiales bacterium PBB3]
MLLLNLNLLATAPGGVARLRELILTLAVRGKLVPQDPKDEPASELLQRVAANAPARSAKGLKASGDSDEVAKPYELPDGWAWSRLGEIVENMGSGWSPACDDGERSDSTQWAVLRTTAVQVNEYRAREHKVIPLKLSPRPEIEVKDGDILITRAGPMNRVGISCWVSNTPPRLMLSDKIVRFHSIADEMLPAFIVLALNAGWTKSQIEDAKTGMAASQVNISQSDLRGLWLPICSKAEQSRIVTRVEELMRLCDALEAKGQLAATAHAQLVSTLLATLTESETPEKLTEDWHRIATHFDLLLDRPEAVDALEQTILQLAVRGLLAPQDPQDEPASELLKKIRAEKDKLIAEGKIKRDKPLPPIADDEQPFALPQGWEWIPIETLADVGTGTTPSRDNVAFFAGGSIPWVTSGETGKPFIAKTAQHVTELALAQTSVTVYPVGTLIVAMYGQGKTRGQVSELQIEATTNQACAAIVLVEPTLAHRSFVKLVFEKSYDEIRELSAGGAQPNLNVGKIKATLIPLPPLAEQSRIVTRVAQLRSLCADLRQRLSASQSTQAHLAEALVQEVQQ